MSYDENRISDQIEGGLNKKEEQQLRDRFAGLAMQGVINYHGQNAGTYDYLARIAYNIADAMLKERKENSNG